MGAERLKPTKDLAVFDLSWTDQPEAGWVHKQGGDEFLRIGSSAPPDLRLPTSRDDPDPQDLIDEWLAGTRFRDWWNQNAGLPGDKVIAMDSGDSDVWQIPWELAIKWLATPPGDEAEDSSRAKRHHVAGLARVSSKLHGAAPSEFDEALRVLVLTGKPNGLDLATEIKHITSAWAELDYQTRRRVEEPEVVPATRRDLVAKLRERRRHLLWFAGHGRVKDGAELLFADGDWVSIEELAADIAESGKPPMFAMFGACDIGAAPRASSAGLVVHGPSFDALHGVGVASMIAMQAPITDGAAIRFAHELFSLLAAGYSIARALAGARGRLLDEAMSRPSPWRLDWAAPVLWTARTPVAALDWGMGAEARSQLLGAITLRESGLFARGDDEAGLGDVAEADRARAKEWQRRPTWVCGDPSSIEARRAFLKVLRVIQVTSGVTVLAIDAGGDEDGYRLATWADRAWRRFREGDAPDVVLNVLRHMGTNPQAGWAQLAALPNVCLAIGKPPRFTAGWFWEPLRSTEHQVPPIVLAAANPTSGRPAWSTGTLNLTAAPEDFEAIVRQAPRLARALAVLNVDIDPKRANLDFVEDWVDEGATGLEGWRQSHDVMIETGGNVAMSDVGRAAAIDMMTRDEYAQAHRDAANMLWEPSLTVDQAQRILPHLIAGRDDDLAAEVGSGLIGTLWWLGDAFDVVNTAKELANIESPLDAAAELDIANALISLRRVDDAEARLVALGSAEAITSRPVYSIQEASLERYTPFVQARTEALWSLIEKARGTPESYDRALRHIESAVQIAGDSGLEHEERNYRQDEALILLHLFGRVDDAADKFGALVSEIRSEGHKEPSADLDRQLAVVLRNHAEAIRKQDEANRGAAERELREALGLVRDSNVPIVAEIQYELAQAVDPAQEEGILKDCIAVADRTGHQTVGAIAAARLYWLSDERTLEGWLVHEKALHALGGGWAPRTLANGRLRAAWEFTDVSPQGAFEQLEANRALFEDAERWTAGRRDKSRIARTYAGLTVLGEDMEAWRSFLEFDWADEWLAQRTNKQPDAVWQDREER